jgi:hypothetical protein
MAAGDPAKPSRSLLYSAGPGGPQVAARVVLWVRNTNLASFGSGDGGLVLGKKCEKSVFHKTNPDAERGPKPKNPMIPVAYSLRSAGIGPKKTSKKRSKSPESRRKTPEISRNLS